MNPSTFTASREPVTDPESVLLRREYLDEVVSRYHGRPAGRAEIEAELADQPVDDLVEPRGTFLVLRDGRTALGCVGVRLLSDEAVELTSEKYAEHWFEKDLSRSGPDGSGPRFEVSG